MIHNTISQATSRTPEVISNLMELRPREIYQADIYINMLEDIDVAALKLSMSSTRAHLDDELPPLVEAYKEKYNMTEFPLTGYMVCNWVVGYLSVQQNLPDLIEKHTTVSRGIMGEALPEILEILARTPMNNEEWVKAFATLVIPLMAE